jgi:hypothetical protein
MTQTQAISQDIRRHPGSFIDFDFYRTRATALRRQALRDATTLRSACAGVLTIVGALAVVFLVAAAPMRAPNGHVAVVQTNAAPIW